MKALKYILLSFVFVIWFSCSKAPKPNIYEHLKPCDINLKTKNPILKSSFTHAVLLADSMVATMFGTDSVLMSMYRKYNFEYIKSCSKGVNDSLPDYPNSFVITYSLKYNGDTIPSPTTIEIDKFGKITHCYFPGFIGLVEAYRNKWKIKTRSEAINFAIHNGLENKRVFVYVIDKEFQHRRYVKVSNSYYFNEFLDYWNTFKNENHNSLWVVRNDTCNGSVFLIDPNDSILKMRTLKDCK